MAKSVPTCTKGFVTGDEAWVYDHNAKCGYQARECRTRVPELEKIM